MEQRAWDIAWVLAEYHSVNVTAAAKLYAAECLKTYEPKDIHPASFAWKPLASARGGNAKIIRLGSPF
jgi:hypothetical protein